MVGTGKGFTLTVIVLLGPEHPVRVAMMSYTTVPGVEPERMGVRSRATPEPPDGQPEEMLLHVTPQVYSTLGSTGFEVSGILSEALEHIV
jgi:hypothetical protein